jgi:dimethylhistidine N-methyltransferase
MDNFLNDVLQDLGQTPKSLRSKYFYDDAGDQLFQKIMSCEEYYPTRCEAEILSTNAADIAETLQNGFQKFDLIELGAGDATKTTLLLKELMARQADFSYMPIDISSSIIDYLNDHLPKAIPGLKVKALNGEYFDMVDQAKRLSSSHKVVLFLGGNIGNMPPEEALAFCRKLRSVLHEGDLVFLGFDLKKHPKVIRSAYDDANGYTKAFNMNLLERINRDLSGNFDLTKFEHYASYDPATGACKSFLISLVPQQVNIGSESISFSQDEYIYMEISQKYSVEETDLMAEGAGFKPVKHFRDSRGWFLDTVWQVV